MKQFGFLLTTLCLLCASSVYAEEYSGTLGDNLSWTLDTETGKLIVSGNGDMVYNENEEAPWYNYRTYITDITISDGITSIQDNAFFGHENLASVSIANSVTSIGKYAFERCEKLASVTLPESLTEIKEGTFYYCSALKSITIPESVTKIGDRAFSISSLTEIIIPDNVRLIGEHAFSSGNNILILENAVISHGVTSIDANAFQQSDMYTCDMVIPSTVTYTGTHIFFYSSINSLYIASNVIGDKLLNNTNIRTGCINLLTETPPTISSSAFYNTYISSIKVPQGCADTYKAADVWSGYNIQEFSDEEQAFYTSYKQLEAAVEEFDKKNLANNRYFVEGEDFSYYISCNDPDMFEGSIEALFDGDNSTFFHSNWHGTNEQTHYIQIDLDGKKSDNIAFSYITRNAQNDFPQAFELQAAVDGVNFTTIKQFDGLPQTADTEWTSGEIALEQEYSHFRINVQCERTYFHMAEFAFSLNSSSDAERGSIYNTDEFNSLREYISEAKQMLGTVSFTAEESADMIKKLNDTYTAALNATVSEPRTFDLTVTQAGYATLFLDYPVGIPEGVEAYTADRIEGIYLKMNPVTNIIPRKTGVIIKAEAGTYTFTENNAAYSAIGRNMLSGTIEDAYITPYAGSTCYVLSVVNGIAGMYRTGLNANGAFKNNANKAYMTVAEIYVEDDTADTSDPSTQLSTGYRFDFAGTTGIEDIDTEHVAPVYYDLSGRRVENPAKGIYIVNGKKVLVK